MSYPEMPRSPATTPADAAATERIFETLLGDDLASRKVFISQNADRYMAQADV